MNAKTISTAKLMTTSA
jgi:hypothetical protein